MKRSWGLLLGALLLGSLACVEAALAAPAAGADKAAPASASTGQWALIEKYCYECHNVQDWAGQIAFDSMSAADIPKDAKIWENAIAKLHGGYMPPPGAKQHPDLRTVTELVSWLEGTLDGHA